MRPPDYLTQDKLDLLAAGAKSAVPDPLEHSQWFAQADEKRRRLAVGSRRYSTVQKLTNRRPRWEDFHDPATGRLLTTSELKAETHAQRKARVEQAKAHIAQRRKDLANVATYGFLPEPGAKKRMLAKSSTVKAPAKVQPMAGHPLAGQSQEEMARTLKGLEFNRDDPFWDRNAASYSRHKIRAKGKEAIEVELLKILADQKTMNPFGATSIKDAYDALRPAHSDLSIQDFHAILARLKQAGAIRLDPATRAQTVQDNPQFILPLNRELAFYIQPAS